MSEPHAAQQTCCEEKRNLKRRARTAESIFERLTLVVPTRAKRHDEKLTSRSGFVARYSPGPCHARMAEGVGAFAPESVPETHGEAAPGNSCQS